MRLDRYISKSRIIDIVSSDLEGALKELLEVCKLPEEAGMSKKQLLGELIEREQTMTTYLGSGIGLPHVRIPMKRPYQFAIGRCPRGLEFEGHDEYREMRLIFLLLASEKEKSYLNVLASLARTFQEPGVVEKLTHSKDLTELRESVASTFGGSGTKQGTKDNKFNRLILKEAVKVAKGSQSSAIMVFGDTFIGGVDLTESFGDMKTILVTQSATEASFDSKTVTAIIPARSFGHSRLSQLRSAMLIGLTRGIIKHNERLCCVGGLPHSNQFDTLVVVDVEREFQSVLTRQTDMLPAAVKPEVLERVLAIATELSVEGREGKPVGSLFVLGDSQQVRPHTKQLVLNPFFGYEAEERNILNPFMDETVKEFSLLDGAFIIRGDGVLEAAGTLIHANELPQQLPSGLGTRHAAAASISMATDCIALVVSASSGQVTLFRRGQMLPLIERNSNRDL
ncbi:diadenylate cyclase [Cerasicoccus maritimus]|uniref:diadenylate cyclase n=1 Tax=Cerasicoccus maritimus TaxID=490089 RepID=UPI0028529CF7|nr:diadenylate cyclase [Cerasicoccus maritimus]